MPLAVWQLLRRLGGRRSGLTREGFFAIHTRQEIPWLRKPSLKSSMNQRNIWR